MNVFCSWMDRWYVCPIWFYLMALRWQNNTDYEEWLPLKTHHTPYNANCYVHIFALHKFTFKSNSKSKIQMNQTSSSFNMYIPIYSKHISISNQINIKSSMTDALRKRGRYGTDLPSSSYSSSSYISSSSSLSSNNAAVASYSSMVASNIGNSLFDRSRTPRSRAATLVYVVELCLHLRLMVPFCVHRLISTIFAFVLLSSIAACPEEMIDWIGTSIEQQSPLSSPDSFDTFLCLFVFFFYPASRLAIHQSHPPIIIVKSYFVCLCVSDCVVLFWLYVLLMIWRLLLLIWRNWFCIRYGRKEQVGWYCLRIL